MLIFSFKWKGIHGILIFLFSFLFVLSGSAQVSFTSSDLTGTSLDNPTSLQFGPDGRLYVAQQDGTIYAYTINKSGPNNYQVTGTETILLVKQIANHNDDGTINSGETDRQVTGILLTGTASNPVMYVSSSDPRIGGGPSTGDVNLDTNSGMITRLTWNGSSWSRVDVVRGLPRSEENHATNGLQLDETNNILYVAQGGHTNAGSPSNNFTFISEYALSGAILTIDLDQINSSFGGSYDLPTLDDPTRPNTGPGGSDQGDPFGGNDGLNQAKLVIGGPVQIHSPGYRNIYDLTITKTAGVEGRLYTIDNGANTGWGGHPENEGSPSVTNNYVVGEPGSTGPGPNDAIVNNLDNLHLVSGPGFGPIYGGHPNPIRANPSGAGLYRRDDSDQAFYEMSPTTDWPPVPVSLANSIESDYQNPGVDDGALHTWGSSTNGLVEYTATNFFGGALTGDLLTASFDGKIYRIELSANGQSATNVSQFAAGFGSVPLDVTAQGTGEIFEGTVWAVTYISGEVIAFEPDSGPDNQEPVASFTASPTNGEAPLTVTLDASASNDPDGSIVSYAWDFGNGTNGTGQNTSVTYNSAGTFTITLTVTDNEGAFDISTTSIDVSAANQAPVASFTATPSAGKAPLTVTLDASASSDPDGSIVSYAWDFGNGTNGTGQNASVTYNSAGSFTITLTVTDDDGAIDTSTKNITVTANQAPVASFTATPVSGEAPLIVTLDASASSDPDGTIVSYNWDFGNGTNGTGQNTSVTYNNAGSFTIILTVTDDNGATATTSKSIDVTSTNQAPVASFTASPVSGDAPLTVTLDASGSTDSDGSIVSYAWDFGNSTNGTGQNTNVTYNSAGSFTITLTVTDDDGGTGITTKIIDVTSSNLAPVASFTANPTSGEAPLTVTLDASGSTDSDGSIVSYDWDFGNGTNGTGQNTNVTYSTAGTFTITLTVTDDAGDTGGTTTNIDVSAPNQAPVASFTATPTTGEAPLTVALNASASSDPDGSIVSYDWDFGNGTNGTGQNTNVTYSTAGTFTITLTVTDDAGATGGTTTNINVSAPNQAPVASFTATPTTGEAPLTVALNASASSDADGSIVSYDWDFGNGTNGTGQNTNVTYNTAGTFTITLTVNDDDGATASVSSDIVITSSNNQAPIASFTATPTYGEVPLSVSLDASGSNDADGNITSYNWDFGNGTNSQGQTINVTYNKPGSFTIKLIVIDNNGASAATSQAVDAIDLVLTTDDDDLSVTTALYPNPFESKLVLISQQALANLVITMYNISGKKIYENRLTQVPESENINLQIPELSKGVYVVTLQTDQRSSTYRMVKY